jgi:uncharacterized protein (DUF488 family)
MTASESLPIHTIGHSTRTIEEFVALLRLGGVEEVVDIRTVPRSRTNPQYNLDALPGELARYQIGHRWIRSLGGLRGKAAQRDPAVNGLWRNRSFHNYADYALGAEFHEGLAELLALAERRRVAIMCAEAVWWRCHRRIVADYLLAAGRTVLHLMGADRIEPAKLTPGAVIDGNCVRYPAPA